MKVKDLARCLLVVAGVMMVGAAAPPPREPTVDELLNRMDDLMRGKSSSGKVTMHVKTARWERTLSMQIMSKGTEQTLIKILSPAKEKGTATLKVGENIWNYLPNVDRTIKVPASMMSGSWMGSHFTNDDLVRESRYTEDFTCRLASTPKENPEKVYVVECIPKPNAPVVWGKVAIKIRGVDQLPQEVTYLDEKGALVRTVVYSDIATMSGRTLPKRMKLTPADKSGEFTEVIYDDLTFDLDLPDSTFSLQALKR